VTANFSAILSWEKDVGNIDWYFQRYNSGTHYISESMPVEFQNLIFGTQYFLDRYII